MATIYLDNLVKPKNYNSAAVSTLNKKVDTVDYTYTDLHLDMVYDNIEGYSGKDIVADYDVRAIRNSIINIFTTRPGEKLLNPLFGCRIDAYLFESISDFRAEMLGGEILKNLETYEPRIEVLNILVEPKIDLHTYYVKLIYKIKDKGLLDTVFLDLRDKSLTTVGTTVSYTTNF